MFSDLAAAREALDEYFNEPGVELLLRLMHTAIVLEPVEVPGAAAGGDRFHVGRDRAHGPRFVRGQDR